MNIKSLQKIKVIENDHTLKILFICNNSNPDINLLMKIGEYGQVIVAVNSLMECSMLVGKLCGIKNFKIVLLKRVPIENYDVLISNIFNETIKEIIEFLKMKYALFLMNSDNFNIPNYYEIDNNCYKFGLSANKEDIKTFSLSDNNPVILNNSNEICEVKESPLLNDVVKENSSKNYDIFIKGLATTEMKYDKYEINYLYAAVPGKVSIIMIVSSLNNKFAETIRNIKLQNVASIEYIIIDNAAGFRNNVKPNIRYSSLMPEQFCIYHAKELCSGEYMIVLNQDSDEINVFEEITNGHYETR